MIDNTKRNMWITYCALFFLPAFMASPLQAGTISSSTLDSNRWEEVAGLPIGREAAAAGTLGGAIYVVGGDGTGMATNVCRFDGTNWANVAGLPVDKTRLTAAVMDGTLYAIAGNSGGSTNVCAFNGTSWSHVAGLPAAREWQASAVLGSAIYAIAGGNFTNVYAFNGSTWSEVEGLPQGRQRSAAAILSNILYNIGGHYSAATSTVTAFDGASWSQAALLPEPRRNLAAAAFDGYIYAMGGDDTGISSNVYKFDGTSWTTAPSLPAPRSVLSAAVLDGKLYAIGGSMSTNVYRYPYGVEGSGVEPESGAYTGGFTVTLTGTGLSDGTLQDIEYVTLCGVTAAVDAVNGSTQIVVTADAATGAAIGTGDIRVMSTSQGISVKTNGFTYTGAPSMRILGADDSLLVSGAGADRSAGTLFVPPMAANAGAVTNTLTIANAGSMSLSVSGHGITGSGADMFTAGGYASSFAAGESGTFSIIFTPTAIGTQEATLIISNDSPSAAYSIGLRGLCYTILPAAAGSQAGGNSITISNGHYGTVSAVTIGEDAASVTGSGQNWVTVTVPSYRRTGVQDVEITTSDNGNFTLPAAYTYNPAGSINHISYDYDSWQLAGSTPLTQYAEYPAMAVYSNALYLMGGKGLTNVYRFADETWTEVASLPHPVYGAVAGTVGNYLYLAGGMNAAGSAITNQMFRFDGTSWTRIADMDYPRGLAAGTIVNGKLHIMGGMDDVGSLPATSVVFDGTNWQSQTFGVVFGLRLGAASIGTNVYVSGGYYGGNQIYYHRLRVTNSAGQMAYASQTFMPNGRAYHASASLDDKVYIIAGRVGGTATSGSWCYDFTNRVADPPNMPLALDSIAAATFEKSIYVTGGSTLNNTTNIYRYPAQSGTKGVVPDSGFNAGGYQVTIIGTNLGSGSDITNVYLCGVAAASIVSQSATQVVISAGAAGSAITGDVEVCSSSYGVTVLTNGFAYVGSGKAGQVITFAQIPDSKTTDRIGLTATASSGLPVSFAVASGPARISNLTNLSFTSYGDVSITASQAGNTTYDAAPDVTRSFTVLGVETFKLTAFALTNSVVLRWPAAQACGFSNETTMLRFSTTDYPATTADGSSISSGTNNVFIHSNRTSGVTCYYSLFGSHDGSTFTNTP